jgi:hypothetical protein
MFAMMDIMCIDNSTKVSAFRANPPTDALVDNHIMKDKVKSTVAKYTNPDRDKVYVKMYQRGIVEKTYTRQAENHCKQIVPLKLVAMYCMMRLMPTPEETVHNKFVSEPRYKFPE